MKLMFNVLVGTVFFGLALFFIVLARQCVEVAIEAQFCDQVSFLPPFSLLAGVLGGLFFGNSVGQFISGYLGAPVTYMPRLATLPIIFALGILLLLIILWIFGLRYL